jgi:hypothetical protein
MVDVWDAHWCGEFQPRGEVEPSPSEDLIWAIQHVGEAAKDELAKVLFYDSLGGYVFEAGDITLSRNLFNFHSIPEFIRWVRERVPSQEC